MSCVELGDEVEEKATGFVGIVLLQYKYLFGQDRFLVQPICDTSYIKPDSCIFYEEELVILKKGKVTNPKKGLSVV